MPLRTAQILVRAPSLEAAGAALERALRRQKLAPGAARELVLLWTDEAAAVVEAGRVDGGLARLLSESLPGPVLAVELDGASLSLVLRRYAEGEPGEARVEPAPSGAALPAFRDVEAIAWAELRAAGVPPVLRLLDFDGLEQVAADDEGGLAGLCLRAEPEGVTTLHARFAAPEVAEGPEAPARPDSLVASAAGEVCALEVRWLPPLEPCAEAAEALAAVEEAAALRLCAQLAAEGDEPRVPRPAFAYRVRRAPAPAAVEEADADPEAFLRPPSDGTEALLPLLQEARARRPWLARLLDPAQEPPLSHAGFADLCLAAVRATLPEARVVRAHGLTLEALHPEAPGATVRAGLLAAFERQLRAAPPVPDPAAPVLEAMRNLLALPAPPVAAWPREAVLAGLLPAVIATADAIGRAAEPLGGLLSAALLCDDGDRVLPVTDADLEAHGLAFDEAQARAIDNADALTLRHPRGLLWFELDHGRIAVTDFDDPAGAGRLLSPLFRSLLVRVMGGAAWAAAPTRDTLLACAPEDPETVRWLREEAARRHGEGPFPVDPGVWDLTEDEARPVADDPLSAVPFPE